MDTELEFYNSRINNNIDYPHTWKVTRSINDIINKFPGRIIKFENKSILE